MMDHRTNSPAALSTGLSLRVGILASIGAMAAVLATPVHADLRDEIAACAEIGDEAARLACFDTAAAEMQLKRDAAAVDASDALREEFRFDRNLLTGPLSMRIEASGNLRVSRDTAVAREVEEIVRRTTKALGEIDGWSLSLIVHGGKVALSRGTPYSGADLLSQTRRGLRLSGLPENRYTVALGEDAEPDLWDDGRIRSANEHIDVRIVGLGNTASR